MTTIFSSYHINLPKTRDDWLNWNTFFSALLYGAVVFYCNSFLAVGYERAEITPVLRPVLGSLVMLLPGLLIVLAFGAYRAFYRGTSEDRRSERRIVTWRRYALPLAILMSLTTIFLSVFLYEDLVFSEDIYTTGFALGAFEFPLFYENVKITVPSTIFWAGYIGYLMTLIGITLQRIRTSNLVPHFYIASSFGLLKSIAAAVLIFLFIDAFPGNIQTDDTTRGLSPAYVILIAFAAGATADDVIAWVISFFRSRLGRKVPEPLPLALVQGIDPTMEAFLHDEGIDSIQILATRDRHDIALKTGLDVNTVGDWQAQANFLRNIDSAQLAQRFHRLGINELQDMKDLDDAELTKALAAVDDKKPDLSNETINSVLIKVLKKEASEGTGAMARVS